jgi:predicted dienelactone hydrolase
MNLAALASVIPASAAAAVGFEQLSVANGAAPPLVVGVWYPTDAPARAQPLGAFVQTVADRGPVTGETLPLIVMSHGTGGGFDGHYDTALALAEAGFVVASVSHTGDTFDDQSRTLFVWERPAQIHRLIDYMLGEWPAHARIDPARVGVFGFSAGGFTALVAAGGAPDLSLTAAHARAHPDYFDAQLVQRASPAARDQVQAMIAAGPSVWTHDARIKAAVVAAPALGYVFGREGLKDVTVPVQLWRAEDDHILPHPDYAEAVRLALPRPPEFHLVANADHFDFLAPCSDLLRQFAPQICVSRPGFDRTAFHQDFNQQVVRFFSQTLR